MNNILQLKGQFQQQSNPSKVGPPSLPTNGFVESSHLEDLRNQLQRILRFWQENTLIKGALVSVHYKHVVAKSNRIRGLLCKGSSDPNDSIRGSRFDGENPIKHVFAHYVMLDVLQVSINRLDVCIDIVKNEYKGKITQKDIEELNNKRKAYRNKKLAKTNFLRVIKDAYYVQRFDVDQDDEDVEDRSIITIYKTNVATKDLLSKLGIDMINAKVIDDTTIRLEPDEIKLLKENAPYLIAMKVRDLREVTPEEALGSDTKIVDIPVPQQEPTIGVIDTPFDTRVYFSEWVTYVSMIDESIEIEPRDYNHGTEVTSIIVDGPTINPELDDGCGRFKVKHFGVAKAGRFSSFSVLKAIREIVARNQDIKVWNLSLGSDMPINRNFISPEAAELDKIQSDYDIIFVIAGTNKRNDSPEKMPIGAPADSLNAVVVNSVNFNNKPASYHRVGPVLSFFHKPDVSYYGGDIGQPMKVCTPCGEGFVMGTSFSAPWISRKMAYLIYNMGFTREVAKALLIDAAAGWNRMDTDALSHSIGYGVVPQQIEKIIQTPSDEIRFIMTGSCDAYETYTYNIPIPIYKNKQPFFARATLCYFPKCSRNQGVDYTSTEMDVHFGRVKEDNGKATIKSINANKQGDMGCNPLFEEEARNLYRKWDNIKLISDVVTNRSKPRKVYGVGAWGLSIKVKERLRARHGRGLPFGVVVTLKEMSGENRIDDFIKLCMVRGWIVNQIDINNRFDIYHKSEEDLYLK